MRTGEVVLAAHPGPPVVPPECIPSLILPASQGAGAWAGAGVLILFVLGAAVSVYAVFALARQSMVVAQILFGQG